MRRFLLAAALAAMVCVRPGALAAADAAPADAAPMRTPTSAAHAHEQVIRERHHAQTALRAGASPEALGQGAAELERLAALLNTQPYLDYAAASTWLYAERLNIAIEQAKFQTRLGNREAALRALESTTSVALIPVLASALEQDPDFAPLKDEPRFKAVLNRYRRGGLTSSKGFASPYAPTLTREQRVAGLSLFWSEVRHSFANVDLMPLQDWNAVYLDYLGKVDKAATTADYYAIMMQLAPLLRDGHTNIYPPPQLQDRFFARPALKTALVEDAVVVTAVRDPQLAARITPGDRILEIDGIDVKTYAERQVAPFVSSGTAQDRQVRMYDYQLLAGDARVPVALTLENARGQRYAVTLPRTGGKGVDGPAFPFRMLSGGIAYLRLDHFESDGGVKAFENAWPAIRQAKGLILDVRTNGGGSSEFGDRILARLSLKPVAPALSRVRYEDPYTRAQAGDSVGWRPLPSSAPAAPLPADQVFAGPVAVLIGPKTFSAAEDFTALFAQAGRGALVGEATAGSTGQPLMLDLPGDGKARICIKRDAYQDGSDFVGTGIRPTLVVENTVAAVRDGEDPALDAAERLLLADPQRYAAKP